jgi:branched-chain amino acid transport system ATP-binding protein
VPVRPRSGRYRPTEGKILYGGQDITRLSPNARATLGIGRTFQNLALFQHMTVLDNIMVGRHHLMRNNFVTGSIYWLTARSEELAHRRKVEDIIRFCRKCSKDRNDRMGDNHSLDRVS